MCGIAGIVATRPIERQAELLQGFSRALQHRGPDDLGFLSWHGTGLSLGRNAETLAPGTAALVHRRLSIVDLSERGWQPMTDERSRHAIALNGEIYNYPELRAELEATGVQFRSQTDTEVLLRLLARSGVAALKRAVGMFAFAFLDSERRKLVLARDPFGIKPLFFASHGGTFAFASEMRPLIDLGFAPRVVEAAALFGYLRHAITDYGEATPVVGVRQLPSAHYMEVDLDTGHVGAPTRYWSPSNRNGGPRRFDDAVAELRGLFRDSVRLHLRADVPVAATLSGGIDSSAIVRTIEELQGASAVFSYVEDDPTVGEERFVDAVAAAGGTRPHKIMLKPDDLADELDRLVLTLEQPFGTSSMWAQSRVFRSVHEQGFKVVLDGQGADELFAGYPAFRAARLGTLLRRGRLGDVARFLAGMGQGRLPIVLQAVGGFLPADLQRLARSLVGRPSIPRWLNASWFRRQHVDWARPVATSNGASDLQASLYDATVASSLPMLLRYADRNAMAVSLENRVPFLTTALADFALSLPDEFLIGPDGTTKRILRTAMRGIVPDVVLARRDKIGFATPEVRWFAESPALRARLAAAAAGPMPECFGPETGAWLRAVAEQRAPYGPAVWRCWNVLRWASLLKLEFPA